MMLGSLMVFSALGLFLLPAELRPEHLGALVTESLGSWTETIAEHSPRCVQDSSLTEWSSESRKTALLRAFCNFSPPLFPVPVIGESDHDA